MTSNKLKQIAAVALSGLLLLSFFSGCGKEETVDENGNTTETETASVEFSAEDLQAASEGSEDLSSYQKITLNGTTISYSGSGATVSGNKITITKGGNYTVSGSLSDGQIIVDSADSTNVVIALNGASINCNTSAPIYIKSAKKAIITLVKGSTNFLTDGTSYTFDNADEEPNATIFSKDDLTINGSGSLSVAANYNNAINCKDDLVITGGTINLTAANNGIKGKDSVAITSANITINAKADGIKSENEEDTTKGYVYIESGTVNITAGEDGIQAQTTATVSGGTVTIQSGGGSGNSSTNSSGNWGDWGKQRFINNRR